MPMNVSGVFLGAVLSGIGVLGALFLSAANAQDANAAELTIVSSGGAYTKSQVEAYHKPFIAKTGVKINSEDYNSGLAEIRAQVEAGNIVWDLVDVEMSDAMRACDEGLLETIDPAVLPPGADGTPAIADFLPGTLHECAVPSIIWSTIFAYDTSKLPNGPKNMADFFDLEKFPGKRGLRKIPKTNLEFALVADGVPAEKVYEILATPQGIDRAFAKLDTIKDEVIWWEAGSQPLQMLADGEVAMTMAYNGRVFDAVAVEGKPFEIVWDGQVYDLELWVILKGSKNREAAFDFLKFATATEQLAAQASFISYGPARASSASLVGKFHNRDIDMKPHMPTHPDNLKNAVQVDSEFWADNADQLNERFHAWLAN